MHTACHVALIPKRVLVRQDLVLAINRLLVLLSTLLIPIAFNLKR